MSRTAYLATVHLLLDCESEAEAADAISALLTENGLYESGTGLIDWSYLKRGAGYAYPRKIAIPGDYDRDDASLCAHDIGGDAIEILRFSNDGDQLSATELRIVELAVNGRLNDKGKVTLAQLLEAVRAGKFRGAP